MRYKDLFVAILVTIAVFTTNNVNALEFSDTFFFGDSLTDSGAFAGNADAVNGETFSLDPGLIWSEVLANSFGLSAIANNPNNLLNTSVLGTNYAQGGAQVTSPIGVGQSASPQAALPLSTQLANYFIYSPTADPNALYTVWGGANDIFFNAGMVGGGLPIATAMANLNTSASDLSGLVTQLSNAGAKYILVPNLPDIGSTPSSVINTINTAGAGNPGLNAALGAAIVTLATPANSPADQSAVQLQALAAAEAALGFPAGTLTPTFATFAGLSTSLTDSYNTSLAATLLTNNANIIGLDSHTLFAEIMADPAEFGLLNVTGLASFSSLQATVTNASGILDADVTPYLFADSVHPSTLGHQIIAQYALSVLEAPALISSLAEIPLGIVNIHQDNVLRQSRRVHEKPVINEQMIDENAASSEWKLFASVGHTWQELDATEQTMESDSDDNYLMLGLSKKLNDKWLLGLALQQTRSDVDFVGDRGGFEFDDTRLSLFGDYQNNRWFAQAIATVSLISDYNDIERKISIGTGQRVEQGDTEGNSFAIKLPVGYNILNKKGLHAGPFGSINYQSINVDGYSEDGSRSTAIAFGDQDRDSFLIEAGVFVDAKLSDKFGLQANLSREEEMKDDDRGLNSNLKSLSGNSFEYDNIGVDEGAWKANLSATMQLSDKTSLGFAYQFRKGDDLAFAQSVNAFVQMNF